MKARAGIALALAAAAVVAVLAVARLTEPPTPPTFASIHAAWTPSESYLLDRAGRVLQVRRTDHSLRRLAWVPLEAVSPALREAVVEAEDRRFRRHDGVDWRALPGALWSMLEGGPKRGASTITMQLAAMLDPALKPSGGRRSLVQKLMQARAALRIEEDWSKDQILEAYLNLLDYRGELRGVAAASQLLLGKDPSGLSTADAAILAALLPAPNASAERVARRACALIPRIDAGLSCATLQERVAALAGGPRHAAPAGGLAPHLAARMLETPGQRLTTTLDADLQAFVAAVLARRLGALDDRNLRDGAVVVADNESGEILAYVASGGPNSRAPRVDGAAARRQAGSTLKPLLYGLAVERTYLTAASLLDDAPINLETLTGLYIPQNYDRDFKGLVSVRTALANSFNIPAVRTLVLTGVEPFRLRLNAFGYDGIRHDGDYYGYALALGSAEVSLLEQVGAYRALARGGVWSPLRLRPDEASDPARRVIDPRAAYIVADILSDRGARSLAFGLANALSTPYWSAAKTGTSKAMRDNWCIGFSDRYTVGVWVGNFEGDSMQDVSGITGAGPIWRDIMDHLHAGRPGRQPLPPPGLIRQAVAFVPAVEPAREEWFLSGTEIETVALAPAAQAVPQILSPANGMIIALDPDIPPERQRVAILTRGAEAGTLVLNGLPLNTAASARWWVPQPGYHTLSMRDSAGREVDSVRFTVRDHR